MRKIFSILFILSVLSFGHAEMCDLSDFVPDFKGSPILVTEYKSELSDVKGTLKSGDKVITSKLLFDEINSKVECVDYNEHADALNFSSILFSPITKKIISMNVSIFDSQSDNYYSYKDKTGEWEAYHIQDNEKKVYAKYSIQNLEGLKTSLLQFLPDGDVIKTIYGKDGKESLVYSYYSYFGDFLYTLEVYTYAEKERKITSYNKEGEISETKIEFFDDSNNVIRSIIKNEYGEIQEIYKYLFDSTGNWIQKDTMIKSDKFDGFYLEPKNRITREITYSKDSKTPLTIKPETLVSYFKDYSNTSTNIETSTPKKYFDHLYISDTIDPIDDKRIVSLSFSGTGGGSYQGDPSLVIRRKEGSNLELYINWNQFLGMETIVTLRVGDETATTEKWGLSTNSKASFYYGDIYALIKKILTVNTVIAKTTPYNESPVTTTFTVSEIREIGEEYSWIFEDE